MERNINLVYLGRRYPTIIRIDEPVEFLRIQIFSLTQVAPEEQLIIGFQCGILHDSVDLSKLNVKDGQRIVLIKKSVTSSSNSMESSSVSETSKKMESLSTSSEQKKEKLEQKDTTTNASLPSSSLPSSSTGSVLWRESCTRIYLKERCVQPSFVHNSSNKNVCFGCATTCHLEGSVSPNTSIAKANISCECSDINGDMCLFSERKSGIEFLQGDEKLKLIDALKNASIQQFQQLSRQKQQQQQQHGGSSSFSASSEGEKQMMARFQSTLNQVIEYENPALQSKARSIIPVATLESRAKDKLGIKADNIPNDVQDEYRHELLQQLVYWYKHEFFSWTNEPPCHFCGGKTAGIGSTSPTSEESLHRAHIVEVYRCTLCDQMTRYPRYNDPSKLLETKSGRCGEWANCFTLVCRAMGFEARYVLDFTDHVWTEVYSSLKGRWLHVDPCEALIDSPLVYESGWGKKLSYVFSFSHEQIVDTIRRYSQKMSETMSRRKMVSEEWLKSSIQFVNQMRSQSLSRDRLDIIQSRYQREMEEMERGPTQIKDDEMQGRISGSKEWREQRKEIGTNPSIQSKQIDLEPVSIEMTKCLLDISGDQFSSSSQKLQLVGNAKVTQNKIRLTSKENDQIGAFWLKQKLNVKNPFDVQFDFQITEPGADGFAFVIQNHSENAIGKGGCDLGYAGIPNSLAVEFDTYCSSDRTNDPNGNHISVQTRKEETNSSHHMFSLGCASDLSCNLNDGRVHRARVLYHDGNLFVFLDQLEKPILKCKILLEDLLGPNSDGTAWIGFTASTGGISEIHDVLSLKISFT